MFRNLKIILPILLSLFLMIKNGFSSSQNISSKFGVVKKGELTLTKEILKKEKSFSLEGKWSFFWNKLISSKDLQETELEKKGELIKVPGPWTDFKKEKLKNFGYSSYILKVHGIPKNTKLSLTATEIPTSFNISIVYKSSDQNLGGLGKVGNSKDKTLPQSGNFINDFVVRESPFLILINVSNFHHRDGGLLKTVKLGIKKEIRKQFEANNYGSFFILGVFLIMAINHLGIYFQRKEDKESLWFSIFCLTMSIRFFSVNSYFDIFFNNLSYFSFALNKKVEYLTFFLIGPIFFQFLKFIFEDYFKDSFLKWFWRFSIFFSIITILTPVYIFTHFTELFQMVLLLASLFLLVQMTRASIKKIPYARICLGGNFILIFGVIYDILVANSILPPPGIILFTSSTFVFIQSYIISKKFTYTYNMAEKLNNELEDKIEKRTVEISGLLNNLESSIFYVRKDLIVTPPFSSYSEKLFKKDINGLNIFEFLFINYQVGSRKYKETLISFQSVFGDDDLNYSFVEVNFPQTIILADSVRPEGKTLKISYSPIFSKNRTVEKLMFIIEDISDFEKYYQLKK